MNKIISIVRIAILLALGMFAIIFLLSEESDSATWLLRVIVDKALGFGAIFLISRLYKRWSKTDPWFIAYDKMCDETI